MKSVQRLTLLIVLLLGGNVKTRGRTMNILLETDPQVIQKLAIATAYNGTPLRGNVKTRGQNNQHLILD